MFWVNKKKKSKELTSLAVIAVLEGDTEGGVRNLKKAVELDPENGEALSLIATTLHRNRKNAEAYKYLESLFSTGNVPAAALSMDLPAYVGIAVSANNKELAKRLLKMGADHVSRGEWRSEHLVFHFVTDAIFMSPEAIGVVLSCMADIDQGLAEQYAASLPKHIGGFIREEYFSAMITLASRIIEENFEAGDRWAALKSELEGLKRLTERLRARTYKDDSEYLRTLFRFLAHRFHPDLAGSDMSQDERTQLMSEINHAYGQKDIDKLEKIFRDRLPKWAYLLRKER